MKSNYEIFTDTLSILKLDELEHKVITEAAYKLASDQFSRGFTSASETAFKTIEALRA